MRTYLQLLSSVSLRVAAAAALLLAGCAGTAHQTAPPPAPAAAGVDQDRGAPTNAAAPRPRLALTEEILANLLIAEFAGQQGQLDIAVERYVDLALTTRDHKIVERAARIAVYARDDAAATAVAQLWVELDPRNPDPYQILAVMQLRAGNPERAAQRLQDIFRYSDGPADQKLWMIANLLGGEKDKEMALDVMETLVTTRQRSPGALYAFAHVASRLGDLQRALALLEETLMLAPDNDNAALSYISILQRQGKRQQALTWLQQALQDRGGVDDFNLRLAYARLLMDARRIDDARVQFELLVASAPENSDVIYMLGLLYLQANQLDDAEVFFKRLAELEKLTPVANYYLGRISEERQDYQQASVWYQGVHGGEHYFDARMRLALLLAKQGQADAARKRLKAIRTEGKQQAIILVQAEGELLVEQSRYAEAIAVYSSVLDKEYNAELLYARAMAAEKIDRLDLLEADLKAILAREPNHIQALNALGYTLADNTERYDEAYALINKALQLSPADFYILDSMGWVLYRMGQLDEAIDYLKQALSIRADPEIAAHLGEALWVRGDREQAREVWEAALKQTPEDARLLDVIRRFNP